MGTDGDSSDRSSALSVRCGRRRDQAIHAALFGERRQRCTCDGQPSGPRCCFQYNSPGLDAGAILAQARDAYAELTSYSDSGTMATRMGSFSQDGTFTIRMQRPSFYRIAWTGLGSGGMAWCDGTGDYLRFAGRADEKQKDRETVLAGATGISGNAASTIPASFFHEQWGAVLNSIGDCHVLPDEPVDSIACSVVISVIHRKGGAEAALERAKRLLLRRLDKSQGEEELKVLLTEVLLESGTYLIPLLHACRRGSLLLA
jgi:hypothetical protein